MFTKLNNVFYMFTKINMGFLCTTFQKIKFLKDFFFFFKQKVFMVTPLPVVCLWGILGYKRAPPYHYYILFQKRPCGVAMIPAGEAQPQF